MTITHADPESLVRALVDAFNAGDGAALDGLYEPGAVLVSDPGVPVTGSDRKAAYAQLLGHGLIMEAKNRHAYTVGELALLVTDWSIRGRTTDGHTLDLGGTATDIARLGGDGVWRYVIDNPMGSA
jgi:ketosteroid isomerase-like protein